MTLAVITLSEKMRKKEYTDYDASYCRMQRQKNQILLLREVHVINELFCKKTKFRQVLTHVEVGAVTGC